MSPDTVRSGTADLDIRILGAPLVTVGGEPLEVDTRKAVALLAHLSADSQVLSRQVAAGFFWPELDEPSARAALRRTLSALRRGVGDAVSADRETIELDASVARSADLSQFLELTRPGEKHGHGSADVCPDCAPVLEEAVSLVRGDFMEGFTLRACPPFEMWQLQWAERVRIRLDEALSRLATACSKAGDYWRAISHTRRRIESNALSEQAWCDLMRFHAWNENRSAALDSYRECVKTLDHELGVSPLETTTELMEAIAEGDLQPAPGSRGQRQSRISDRAVTAAAEQVLEAAAVVPEPFDLDSLRAVSGRSEPETVAAVDEMLIKGDLVEGSPGSLAFAEPASRNQIYASLPLSRRRRLHERCAETLLARPGLAHSSDIAHQLEQAGQLVDAAKQRVVSAEAGLADHRLDAALEDLDAALALGHPSLETVHEKIGDIHTLAGRYGEALGAYHRAAGQTPSPAIEAKIGSLFARVGRWELATHHLTTALEDHDPTRRGRVLVDLGMVAVRSGRLDDALKHAAEARQNGADDLRVMAQVENLLGVIAIRSERADDAMRHLDQANQLATRIGDMALAAAVSNNRGLALVDTGRVVEAVDSARLAVATCREIGDRHGEAAARNNLADHLRQAGRSAEAVEEVARGVTIMADIGVEKDKLEPEIWRLTEW